MTLPDELVKVATRAIRGRFQAGQLGGMEGAAEAALAAAFAALPECEEAVRVSGFALLRKFGASHPDLDHSLGILRDEARVVFDALAREFGEAT